MVCVRPGVLLVNASPFCPVRALIRLDFPTLLLPKNAISGSPLSGKPSGLPALVTNSVFKSGPKSPFVPILQLNAGRHLPGNKDERICYQTTSMRPGLFHGGGLHFHRRGTRRQRQRDQLPL